ncbi:MAG: hypothetical protein COZ75_07160 [Flavobacteriaceae bacterium CG_4_8_14_3_um_filter_34_10]|nr:hypothetical protein [Flavobacteriia bacterium]OIP50494.1 MAG: hypothetical protein AUK33_07280 [Flavobacteriaceae bacterium CG2_30_34_30]PIV48436.1 MAG: hypothetical protein COS19_13825 [Flavobacteriaceae bacterium CG02_land_8_20_14_3_00_34_13]PIX09351.1 MAG: hypothetical protein COZ75_07160 [Flavobacteriaceae bacterium CG_4_8_14_3_um_filter_34_10]PIZ08179.1 MAG: hypothetical protein COY56_05255 [Flavobacteriaceae bacterium CG_4_10_14_0_8_um_filter_34_31]PJC07161.1 MAG: hypothetical protei
MTSISPHHFHIPVMGIAFTIDSPLKVAAFGISSALSIIEDNLIEAMRKYYYQNFGETYIPITTKEENYRSKRITDYLNLIQRHVQEQIEKIKNAAFETGSDVVKYFEMLPDDSLLKETYLQFMQTTDLSKKTTLENLLRKQVKPGIIEVNIMTKVDKNNVDKNGYTIENGSDALEALKAYAESSLKNSAVIFSAGMNPSLYNYLENFAEFDAKAWGNFEKRVVIKVSDYRSALIQGKYLAKKGIWVSEFRIESGLNCGGHAFATQGLLLGPILQEFKNRKTELAQELFGLYNPYLLAKGKAGFEKPHPIKITVQGGIGTFEEAQFLQSHYGMDSTGWGTPFLLCPEATTVDEETLQLLSKAKEKDVFLSNNSPLGVRFNYLKNTGADKEKLERIQKGTPGSPCTEKYLVSNTEFTKEPICTASKKYQKLKLKQLENAGLQDQEYKKQVEEVISKECLCIGLSNAASVAYKIPFVKKLTAVNICPGPNIANYSKIATLQEMTDHIYGRANLVTNSNRPHMFIKELELYIDYYQEMLDAMQTQDKKGARNLNAFGKSLLEGISYYETLQKTNLFPSQFIKGLVIAEKKVTELMQRFQLLN